ncbi:MAG TPA: HAMP domain-containing sensor histidine kinase [Candidatus Binataceae bacterium]|nr:HAMP domain-containing sensor histidine kinase [Candidatus Binataceae bacterium]
MRLIDFIRTQPDAIEREWEQFAKNLTPFAAGLSVSTLRDHLREILAAVVDDMEAPQTAAQQVQKSKGEGPRSNALDRITATHAGMRLDSGFELEHAIAEYRALRASILRLWSQSGPSPEERDVEQVTRFNETIDQSIAEIVRRFSGNATRYSNRLVGILVHDVRTPLNSINMAAYQLQQGSLSDMQANSVSRIFRSVRRIDRLVSDLAVLVRSRIGSPLPLRKAIADLGAICEQVLEEVKASRGDTVFEVRKSGDLSGNWDSEQLARVVSNLAINAIVHGSARKVDIDVQGDGPEVVLKVTNYGSPIPVGMLDSIFEPLVHESRTSPHEASNGLGLGLFIVQEIAKAHGGAVQVISSEAEGTTFTMRLPRNSD